MNHMPAIIKHNPENFWMFIAASVKRTENTNETNNPIEITTVSAKGALL